MNTKSIWQGTVAAVLVSAAVGTVALAADTLSMERLDPGTMQLASRDGDDDRGYRDDRAGVPSEWIGIDAALAAVTAAGYHDVREIERERYGYEAKAYDGEGRRWELKLDGATGEIIDRERD